MWAASPETNDRKVVTLVGLSINNVLQLGEGGGVLGIMPEHKGVGCEHWIFTEGVPKVVFHNLWMVLVLHNYDVFGIEALILN